mmetsp:Transcript_2091/g.3902  ORF Transcript_2091/g.3902 Transcript_2091/m.3902 type:complete len:380 (-) Transcript_2091:1956-3095(-)
MPRSRGVHVDGDVSVHVDVFPCIVCVCMCKRMRIAMLPVLDAIVAVGRQHSVSMPSPVFYPLLEFSVPFTRVQQSPCHLLQAYLGDKRRLRLWLVIVLLLRLLLRWVVLQLLQLLMMMMVWHGFQILGWLCRRRRRRRRLFPVVRRQRTRGNPVDHRRSNRVSQFFDGGNNPVVLFGRCHQGFDEIRDSGRLIHQQTLERAGKEGIVVSQELLGAPQDGRGGPGGGIVDQSRAKGTPRQGIAVFGGLLHQNVLQGGSLGVQKELSEFGGRLGLSLSFSIHVRGGGCVGSKPFRHFHQLGRGQTLLSVGSLAVRRRFQCCLPNECQGRVGIECLQRRCISGVFFESQHGPECLFGSGIAIREEPASQVRVAFLDDGVVFV